MIYNKHHGNAMVLIFYTKQARTFVRARFVWGIILLHQGSRG